MLKTHRSPRESLAMPHCRVDRRRCWGDQSGGVRVCKVCRASTTIFRSLDLAHSLRPRN
ncbi:MAG: hypothetical protein SNG27_09185 [Rikenellaceae bacterium]